MSIFDIPFLATTVAIIISWAMFATFCSLLCEAVAQIKAERGRFMKNYLFSQLNDIPNGINWASLVYLHGSIDLLSRDPAKPTNDIPPKLFAETLIEVVGNAHAVQSLLKNLSDAQGKQGLSSLTLKNFKGATQVLNPSDVMIFLNQAINSAELKAGRLADGTVSETEVYKLLVENIETWFQDLMGRLSLWYKKRTRERLFYLGVLVGTIINVDSIQLFSFYEENPTAKSAVIEAYERNEKEFSAMIDTVRIQKDTTVSSSDLKSLNVKLGRFAELSDSLQKAVMLPVGIQYNVYNKTPKGSSEIFYKIIGVLITGLAASFGAPFWFEVLRKIYATKKI